MEINTNPTTSLFQETSFVMTTRGCTFGSGRDEIVLADSSAMQIASARTRKAVATKGHVALIAYVPGLLAWSPPI